MDRDRQEDSLLGRDMRVEDDPGPGIRGGQGRTDGDTEQSGLIVGIVILMMLGFIAGLCVRELIG